eukprot:1478663-Prymnesium_polylepis.1
MRRLQLDCAAAGSGGLLPPPLRSRLSARAVEDVLGFGRLLADDVGRNLREAARVAQDVAVDVCRLAREPLLEPHVGGRDARLGQVRVELVALVKEVLSARKFAVLVRAGQPPLGRGRTSASLGTVLRNLSACAAVERMAGAASCWRPWVRVPTASSWVRRHTALSFTQRTFRMRKQKHAPRSSATRRSSCPTNGRICHKD